MELLKHIVQFALYQVEVGYEEEVVEGIRSVRDSLKTGPARYFVCLGEHDLLELSLFEDWSARHVVVPENHVVGCTSFLGSSTVALRPSTRSRLKVGRSGHCPCSRRPQSWWPWRELPWRSACPMQQPGLGSAQPPSRVSDTVN